MFSQLFLCFLTYLLLRSKVDLTIDTLCFFSLVYCFVFSSKGYFTTYQLRGFYEVLSIVLVVITICSLKTKELFLIGTTTVPLKIYELLFYYTPSINIPFSSYLLSFDCWFLYGVIGLLLKFNTDNTKSIDTKQTILNSVIAFIFIAPLINRFI